MPLSGHLTDPNYITQTPSGTLDNTALTLIQVLNLPRGLAVIYLNYSLFSISCSYEDENDCQNLKKQFLSPSDFCYFESYSWHYFSFSTLELSLCYFSISGYLLLTSGLLSLCLHIVISDLRQVPWLMCRALTQPSGIAWLQSINVTMTYTKLTS